MDAPSRIADEVPAASLHEQPEASAPEVLRARPVEGPVDLEAMLDDIEARFPKTLARLAE